MWSCFEISSVAAAAINYYTLQCRRQEGDAVIKCKSRKTEDCYCRLTWRLTEKEQISRLMELHAHLAAPQGPASHCFHLHCARCRHADATFTASLSVQIWEKVWETLCGRFLFLLFGCTKCFCRMNRAVVGASVLPKWRPQAVKKHREVPRETCGECVCDRVYADRTRTKCEELSVELFLTTKTNQSAERVELSFEDSCRLRFNCCISDIKRTLIISK